MDYDLIVIGGGVGGYVASIRAAQEGLKTCVIEKEHIGGTCLNVGCIPTKVLLKSVEMLDSVKQAEKFGVDLNLQNEPSLDLESIQRRKNEIIRQLVYGIGVLLRNAGVEVIEGEASFVDSHKISINGRMVQAKNIIIATGSKAKRLHFDNDNSVPIYDSSDILSLSVLPSKIAIVGAGVIGMELAFFLHKNGVEVVVIEFLDSIFPTLDQEIAEIVKQDLEKLGIKFYLGSRVSKVNDHRVFFEKEGLTLVEQVDAVLVAIGREANVEGLNLEKIGITLYKDGIKVDNKLRTNIPNVYAVGDVNGQSMLAHTASMEGLVAVENILKKDISMNYANIPNVIYIQPEIASIGLTEEQAKQKYGDILVGRFPMTANAMAGIIGNNWGMIKVISEPKYNEVLGVHMYCVNASELIAEVSVAVAMECTIDELEKIVHPHPSVSEAVFESYLKTLNRAIHN